MPQFVIDMLYTGIAVATVIVLRTAARKRIESHEMASTTPCSSIGQAQGQTTKAHTTKPRRIGCSKALNLFHSAGKHQRDPLTSTGALSCIQSDGSEQSWFLPGNVFRE
ncbi:hypothetical protein ABEW05_005906 [Botrytis cinerea]